MAQIVKLVCDHHAYVYQTSENENEVAADAGTQILQLNKKVVELDTCHVCLNELTDLLEPWFRSGRRPGSSPVAVPPKPKKEKPAPQSEAMEFKCRWPEGCTDVRPTSQGRTMHERRAHGYEHAAKELVSA